MLTLFESIPPRPSLAVKMSTCTPGAWFGPGCQVKTPVAGSNVEPCGRPEAERVTGRGGIFVSTVTTAKESIVPGAIDWARGTVSAGADIDRTTWIVTV